MTLSGYASEHPYRSVAGILLAVVLVVLATGILNVIFLMGNLVQLALEESLFAGIGIILLSRLDWWKRAGYTTGIRMADLPLCILPAAVALLSLGEGIRVTTPLAVLAFAGLTILVGFAEESVFRGLIFTTLLPTGTTRAVVISSFFFAAPHLLNIIGGIWNPAFAVVDSVTAFGIGITFAAIRLRTGSIWPLVGLHALFDFCSLIVLGGIDVKAQSAQSLFASIFFGVVFMVYGMFLLRKGNYTGQEKE